MAENRSGSSGAFIGGLVLGATVGAIAGLLSAPKSGRETRRILKKSADALPDLAEDLSTSVQLQADRLSASALRNWDETLVRLREAIAAGIEASQRENQRLNVANVSNTATPLATKLAESEEK
ncbi:MAG: YtxH domain-containing protein [Synechococcales bacterium]|nr:YtxH domain-containing protein [Synechococcales bacterium]